MWNDIRNLKQKKEGPNGCYELIRIADTSARESPLKSTACRETHPYTQNETHEMCSQSRSLAARG